MVPPVLTDRCLDGDSPGQGPCPSQQGVHHGHWQVLPLPGGKVILFHDFGHRQLLEQMVDPPENQGKRQHWQAGVTLERREQRFHPRLPPCTPLLATLLFLLTSSSATISSRWLTDVRGMWWEGCAGSPVARRAGVILRFGWWRNPDLPRN